MHETTLQVLECEKNLGKSYSKLGGTEHIGWIPSGNLNYPQHRAQNVTQLIPV